MAGANVHLLRDLIAISKIDAATVRIAAERKKIENELNSKRSELKRLEAEQLAKSRELEERKKRYEREEKSLKEERERLIARRKALHTLSSYKLQQSAEKEIEFAARQLGAREELLVGVLDEAERLEESLAKLAQEFGALHETLNRAVEEANAAFATFEERLAQYSGERNELASQIEPSVLAVYERLRERFPADSLVAVEHGSCTGCFIQVAPQLLVEISRGDKLVRCRGCGRILFVPESDSSEASSV